MLAESSLENRDDSVQLTTTQLQELSIILKRERLGIDIVPLLAGAGVLGIAIVFARRQWSTTSSQALL
ncbi:MAG: hypothetical protein ACI95C_000315 [Pseudohongiellaceae bacterium]|jgi:hypothetical protein